MGWVGGWVTRRKSSGRIQMSALSFVRRDARRRAGGAANSPAPSQARYHPTAASGANKKYLPDHPTSVARRTNKTHLPNRSS